MLAPKILVLQDSETPDTFILPRHLGTLVESIFLTPTKLKAIHNDREIDDFMTFESTLATLEEVGGRIWAPKIYNLTRTIGLYFFRRVF